jgi:hypothetical protein
MVVELAAIVSLIPLDVLVLAAVGVGVVLPLEPQAAAIDAAPTKPTTAISERIAITPCRGIMPYPTILAWS